MSLVVQSLSLSTITNHLNECRVHNPNGKGKDFSTPAVAKSVIGLRFEEPRHSQVDFESDCVLC